MVLGEEAHIVGKEDDGPRGDSSVSVSERNSYHNLILLCPTHHTLIDKENGKHFSVDQLKEMKRSHEMAIELQRRGDNDVEPSAAIREAILYGLSASRARLITRWIAVGVDPEVAEELADDTTVGHSQQFSEFHTGRDFSILLGDFGAGKTVALEREYQASALAALENSEAAFPVYINSKIGDSDLSRIIDQHLSVLAGRQRKVTIFLDGLDEFGAGRSAEIIDDLKMWIYSGQKRKVLATSRPDAGLRESDCLALPPLSDEELGYLLERVGADRVLAWSHSPEVRDALHRPLFALIAADCRKVGSSVPNSRGAFLEALVERALARSTRLDNGVHYLLAKLGYETLNSGGYAVASEVGSREEQRRLVETRLVVSRDKTLSFALPVLGQYFAGQFILENGLPDVAQFSPSARDQWREAFVFAVAAGSWRSITTLLEELTAVDPGLATWVVSKAVPVHGIDSPVGLPDVQECGNRLSATLDTWLDGIGTAGTLLECSDGSGKGVPLGVGVSGSHSNHLFAAFIDPASYTAHERHFEIATRIDWDREEVDGWRLRSTHGISVPSNFSAWPWSTSLGWVRDGVTKALKKHSFPLENNDAALAEEAWHNIRTLTNQRGFSHHPIERDLVLQKIDEIFQVTPDFRMISIQGKASFTYDQLANLRAQCANGQLPNIREGKVHRPYPVTDITPSAGSGHIASCYSDLALRELVEKAYLNALSIYEDLLTTYFNPLRRTLRLGGMLPVEFRCKLSRVPEGVARLRGEPMFSRIVLPLPQGSSSTVHVTLVDNLFDEPEYSSNWGIQMTHSEFRQTRPKSAAWSSPTASHERLGVFGNRPAVALAYMWLWNDLKEIGLVEGNAPSGD